MFHINTHDETVTCKKCQLPGLSSWLNRQREWQPAQAWEAKFDSWTLVKTNENRAWFFLSEGTVWGCVLLVPQEYPLSKTLKFLLSQPIPELGIYSLGKESASGNHSMRQSLPTCVCAAKCRTISIFSTSNSNFTKWESQMSPCTERQTWRGGFLRCSHL